MLISSYTLQSHHLVLYGYRPVFSLFRRLAVILYKFVIYTHISFYLIYSCFLFYLDTYKILFRYLQNHNYIRIPLIYLSFDNSIFYVQRYYKVLRKTRKNTQKIIIRPVFFPFSPRIRIILALCSFYLSLQIFFILFVLLSFYIYFCICS